MITTSFSSPKTKVSLSNPKKSNKNNDNDCAIINGNLNNNGNNNQLDPNSTLSNILDIINENNLNVFYDNDTSNFKHNIDQLNLKFYLETEKIISSNNLKDQNINSNKLFVILFKQINLYISEIERLNTIILNNKRDPHSIRKKLAVIDRQKTDFETKEQIIQTLKYANKALEKRLSNLLESENILRQQNAKLLEEKNFYYDYYTKNNYNNYKTVFRTEGNINTASINLSKNHHRAYSLQNEDVLNNLNPKNKNIQVKNNNTKTNLLLNSDTFKHKNKNFAFKSFQKNEIIINQKNNQSVKKDSKKNIHKKNKKNLISLGNKNSKLELQINDSVCNNQSCSFMNTPIVKYTNTQKYRTTTSKIIKKEDFFMTENNYLNSMENLLLEIKNHLEIKNTKNKNKNKNTKNSLINNKNISLKTWVASQKIKS